MPTIPAPGDGTELAYDLTGSGDGVPVVLLHGSVLSRAIWRGLGYLDPLLSAGHPVLRMDLRGHGRSGKPHDVAAYAADRQREDLLAVMDAAGLERAALVGYSLGSRVALSAALENPDRVAALVCLGGSARSQRGALDSVFFPGVIDAVRTEGMEAFCAAQGLGPEVEDRFGRSTRQAFLAADPQAMAALFTATEATEGIEDARLAACEVPALWMAGTDDHPRCEDSAAAAGLMPRARFVPLPGRTHGSTLSPAGPVLAELLAFLHSL